MIRRTVFCAAAVALLATACGSSGQSVATVAPSSSGAGAKPADSTGSGAGTTATSAASETGTTIATGGAPAPEAATLLAKVSDTTKAAKSASFGVHVGVVAKGVPTTPDGTIDVTGQGAFDYEAKQGTLHVDFSGLPTTKDGVTATDLVFDGSTTYVKLPDSLVAKNGGKHWTKVTPESGSGDGFNINLSDVQQVTDPDYFLKMLQGVAGTDITKVGTEQLHGRDTTHYHVDIDMAKAAKATDTTSATADTTGGSTDDTSSGTSDGTGFAESFGALFGDTPVPADLWIDGDGRLAKFAISLDLSALLKAFMGAFPSDSGPTSTLPDDFTMKISMGMELWDFGKAVDVIVPPASDVAEGVEIPGLGGTGSGDGFPSDTSMPTDTTMTSGSTATTSG